MSLNDELVDVLKNAIQPVDCLHIYRRTDGSFSLTLSSSGYANKRPPSKSVHVADNSRLLEQIKAIGEKKNDHQQQ